MSAAATSEVAKPAEVDLEHELKTNPLLAVSWLPWAWLGWSARCLGRPGV